MDAVVAEPVVWTRQQPRLWTARRDGRPLGVVERGRRYDVTGLDGVVRGGFRTLAGAQAALETGSGSPEDRPLLTVPSRVLVAIAAAAAGAGAVLALIVR